MRRREVDLIVAHASEIVTPTGKNARPASGPQQDAIAVVPDGALAIERGTILQVGRSSEILSQYRSRCVIDATRKTVLPGLVDPHTHLVYAGSREREFEMKIAGKSYMEILAAGGGILSTVAETRKTTKHRLIEICRARASSLLAHGTTTIEVKSGYGLSEEEEIKCLEVARSLDKTGPFHVVPTFLGAHAVPQEYEGRTDEYVNLTIEKMIPSVAKRKLAQFCERHADAGYEQAKKTAREQELKMPMFH